MADVRNRVYVELIATGTRDVETATAKAAESVREVGQAAKAAGTEVAKSETAVNGFASALSSGLARGAAGAADAFGKLEGAVGAALKPLGIIGAVIGGIEAAIALYERAVEALDDEIKTGADSTTWFADQTSMLAQQFDAAAQAAAREEAAIKASNAAILEASAALPGMLTAAERANVAERQREQVANQAALAQALEEEAAARAANDTVAARIADVNIKNLTEEIANNRILLETTKELATERAKAAGLLPDNEKPGAPKPAGPKAKPFDFDAYARRLEELTARITAAADAAIDAEATRLFEQQQSIEAVEAGTIIAQQAVDELSAHFDDLGAAMQEALDMQAVMDFADGITTGAGAARTALSAWSGALKQLGVGVRTISFFEGLQATADAADAVADSIKAFASGNPISGAGFVAAAAAYAVSAGAYFKAAGKGSGGGSTAAAAGAGSGAAGASAQPRSGDFGGKSGPTQVVYNVNNFDGTFFATEDAALRGLGEAAMRGMNNRARGAARLRQDVVDSPPVATGRR